MSTALAYADVSSTRSIEVERLPPGPCTDTPRYFAPSAFICFSSSPIDGVWSSEDADAASLGYAIGRHSESGIAVVPVGTVQPVVRPLCMFASLALMTIGNAVLRNFNP